MALKFGTKSSRHQPVLAKVTSSYADMHGSKSGNKFIKGGAKIV